MRISELFTGLREWFSMLPHQRVLRHSRIEAMREILRRSEER